MATVNHEDRSLKWYLAREPIVLLILTLLTVVFFSAVTGLSRVYHRQQEALGERWFRRGNADLRSGRLDRAVTAFHTALLFSRDNYTYQLSLAEALAAWNRKDEAYAYLLSLWEREPENGTVNLELARIFASKGDANQAIRYYHNAIYALWPDHPEEHRRSSRFELIEFLLRKKEIAQAQSELIALTVDLPDDAALHDRVGDLFMQTQDYEHAIDEYRQSLRLDRHNHAATAGVGRAAFELGRYALAQRYLQTAVSAGPNDIESAQLLDTVNLVLRMDPYRRQISASQRNRIVVEAFGVVGDRLKACAATTKAGGVVAPTKEEQTLYTQWSAMKPKITEWGLRRDPDMVEKAMDLVFTIERQTSTQCGPPAGKDLALLLISKLHEGS
jgi:tetratricopeptide (TPR) repeat protein